LELVFSVGLDWLVFCWIGLIDFLLDWIGLVFLLDWIGWFFCWIGLVGFFSWIGLVGFFRK
jgi:hypothetical protein